MVKCECGEQEAYDLSSSTLKLICPDCSTRDIWKVYLRAYYKEERRLKDEGK